MAVRLRLQRHGKKGKPFYHVIAADQRSPRDGKFIERIGSYDPTSIPATIHLDVEKAVKWLQNGAEPTDTVRAILRYKGATYKNHLLNGVRKGALKAEDVDAKFNKWLDEKNAKIEGHKTNVAKAKSDAKSQKLAEESQVKEARLKAVADAKAAAEAEAAEAAKAAKAAESPVETTEPTAEANEETAAE